MGSKNCQIFAILSARSLYSSWYPRIPILTACSPPHSLLWCLTYVCFTRGQHILVGCSTSVPSFRYYCRLSWASVVVHLVKNLPECKRTRFNSWVRKICWRRDRLPIPVFLGFPIGSAGKESLFSAALASLPPSDSLDEKSRSPSGFLKKYLTSFFLDSNRKLSWLIPASQQAYCKAMILPFFLSSTVLQLVFFVPCLLDLVKQRRDADFYVSLNLRENVIYCHQLYDFRARTVAKVMKSLHV